MAARIYEYNASGFGGADSSVELFAAHGFQSKAVFFGDYGSVAIANVRWRSDSELVMPTIIQRRFIEHLYSRTEERITTESFPQGKVPFFR